MHVRAWLDRQRPAPPPELVVAIVRALDDVDPTDPDALSDASRTLLSAARARPGRVRESAFDLLAADALITYACIAMLDDEDPEARWIELISIGELG
ncbi:MAG: hypothetical protein AAF389_07660 [Gemmatimonadota bacterium]